MPGFLSRRIRPVFLTAPAEPSLIAPLDDRLRALAVIPRAYRAPGWPERVDALLDERLMVRALRPAEVPVIPGRAS